MEVKKLSLLLIYSVRNSSEILEMYLVRFKVNEQFPEFTNNDSLFVYPFNLFILLSKFYFIYFLNKISLFFLLIIASMV